ncbi:MAG: hypothetical protein ABI569_04925 [Casimicrobiaceae bacterium]
MLLYSYYTIRTTRDGPYNSLFIVTNTAADTKVIRVRFRESKNGRPVQSVNVYLVPNDSFAAAVVPDPASTGAELLWYDQSCVDPPFAVAVGAPYTLPFNNLSYSGLNSDFEDPSLARTGEGYIEIFELGVVKDATVLAALKPDRTMSGVVPDCPTAVAVALDDVSKIGPPTGGLMGSGFLINVFAGTLYSYDATALDDFTRVALWSRPTAATPTLDDVNPKLSRIFDGAVLRQSSWDVAKGARPADPVSAVLMQDQLLNFFVLDPGTGSQTDWIVTMPTKPNYVSVTGAFAPPPAPFESSFNKGGAPDSFDIHLIPCNSPTQGVTIEFDREGFGPALPLGCPGVPPGHLPFSLPWTANVVAFDLTYSSSSNVFASSSSVVYGTAKQNGWMRLGPLPNAAASLAHKLVSTDSPPVTYYGLPMIGFMANSYYNGAIPGPLGNLLSAYGATSLHKGVTRIE